MRQLSISLGLGETFLPEPERDALGRGRDRGTAQVHAAGGGRGQRLRVKRRRGLAPGRHRPRHTGPTQAEFPASDPFVIAVGGTSLTLAARTGNVSDETGWQGSGGGHSIFFPRPAYQVGRGVVAGTDRLVPDVSAAADPETGALIVIHGLPTQIGGTSSTRPVWAGLLRPDGTRLAPRPASRPCRFSTRSSTRC